MRSFLPPSVAHEKEIKELQNQMKELERQKEAALREVAELKVQLKMVEETRDAIRRDLIEANRAIREGEEVRIIAVQIFEFRITGSHFRLRMKMVMFINKRFSLVYRHNYVQEGLDIT